MELSLSEIYDLTLLLSLGVLIDRRALVVVNNEWEFYSRKHRKVFPIVLPSD